MPLGARGNIVLDLSYSFASEHPFLAVLDGTIDGARWLRQKAAALGAGGERMVASGESATTLFLFTGWLGSRSVGWHVSRCAVSSRGRWVG